VKFAKSKGLPVVLGDGVTFLENNKGFDLIILTDVVEHMKKDELLGLLRRSYEALVPDGHIIIRTPNASSIFGCYGRYIDFTHEISFTEQSLRQVLLATGFENVKLTDTKIPIGWKPKRLGRWLVVKIWRFFLQLLYMAELGTTRPRLCGGNLIACAYKPKCQPE
jgi:predicted TPR repeat methyltransferase